MGSKLESRWVLAENVRKLAVKAWGDEHITPLGRETGIETGGAQRILGGRNVGPDLIDKVAKYFNCETWMLFVPGFDPDSKPVLAAVSAAEREAYQKLVNAVHELGSLAPAAETHPKAGKKGGR